MDFGLGYDPALEVQHADQLDALPRLVCAPTAPIPEEVDPRGIILPNNQGRRNSCCGCARDKVVELCHWIETGEVVNLSARYSYVTTKIVDGTINSGDAGASISGAALASSKFGECLESLCPYWHHSERYHADIPKAAYECGDLHRIRSTSPLHTPDGCRQWIGAGQGGILLGISWTEGLANFRGKVLTLADLGGRYLGEHAVAILGYLRDGKFLLWNSHGETWGTGGVAELAPEVTERFLQTTKHGFRGFSDLPSFVQRPFTWKGAMGWRR